MIEIQIRTFYLDQIERSIIPGLLNLVKENNEDFHIDCIQVNNCFVKFILSNRPKII